MKLKKIVLGLLETDILNFLKLQNKVNINHIKIEDKIFATGEVEFLKLRIKFKVEFNFLKVEHNMVYVNVDNFKVYDMSIPKAILNKSFNFIIKAFTEIEGISFDKDTLKLEVSKLINKYYKEQKVMDISNLEVQRVSMLKGEIEIEFGGIGINSKVIEEEINGPQVEYVEAEVVYDGME